MKLFIPTFILVAVAFLLLGVKVLFVKGGKFPSGHVHDIGASDRKNVTCAHTDDRKEKQ